MENVYFFAKTMFGYGEFEGASGKMCKTRFWPKMGRFTRFTRFTRPACNAKHTYASTRVLRPLLLVATTLRKHISSDVRPKNWPELILGLCPTAPEGVGCVFFRVTASRAKRAFWPMASPLASLAGWINLSFHSESTKRSENQ